MKTEPEKPAEAGRLEAETGRNPPLDHASARIVSELAARLLPPLKEELSALRTLEDKEKDAAWRGIREAVSELAARPRIEPEGNPARWEALARSLEDTNRRIALPSFASFSTHFSSSSLNSYSAKMLAAPPSVSQNAF